MDSSRFDWSSYPSEAKRLSLEHLVPYAVLLANYLLFKLARALLVRVFAVFQCSVGTRSGQELEKRRSEAPDGNRKYKWHSARLFLDELLSTCELCTACAEMNVVHEKHGTLAYGAVLFLLTYLWIETFGQAHASPGYLAEDYFLVEGNRILRASATYARLLGQSLAVPLAWRLLPAVNRLQELSGRSSVQTATAAGEFSEVVAQQRHHCRTSLTTSVAKGTLIELTCCFAARLAELLGTRLLEAKRVSSATLNVSVAFISTGLVLFALELTGGYMNPVLASGLELGCQGAGLYQHALVFWLGPLLGHLVARSMFRKLYGERLGGAPPVQADEPTTSSLSRRRQARSSKRKRS